MSVSDYLIIFSLFLIMASSMVVSAFHTIPTILNTMDTNTPSHLQWLVAGSAFLMFEVLIVVVGYFLKASGITHGIKVGIPATILLIIGLVVIMGINQRDVSHNQNVPALIKIWRNVGDTILFSAVGVVAPLFAFLSGDLLAYFTVQKGLQYKRDIDEWNAGMKRSWDSRKGKLIPKEETANPVAEPVKVATRYGKARVEAVRYFNDHPEMLQDYSLDEITEHAGNNGYEVKRGTLYKVWKEKQ
jgi:hypothetical protein